MKQVGDTGEKSLALFLLGLLLFSPPLLSLFSVERVVAGIPLLYLYLFSAWGLLIVLIGMTAAHRAGRRSAAAEAKDRSSAGGTERWTEGGG